MKMNKIIFLALMLFLILSVPSFSKERIVDNAGIFSNFQKTELSQKADSISQTYKFDLVIVIENNISQTPESYADDFFDYNNYGFGSSKDGCLFLIVVNSRDYHFSTTGRSINLLDYNDYAFDKLEKDAVKYLSRNDFYDACFVYLKNMELFLSLEAMGRRYNFFYQWNILLVVISWLASLGIGSIVVSVWKKGMNTVRLQTYAEAYEIPGSLNFTVQKDRFLYSTITKTRRDSSSSGSGGGLHTGSSGTSHGGRGGKF